jgi:hypothetical protein
MDITAKQRLYLSLAPSVVIIKADICCTSVMHKKLLPWVSLNYV